MDPVFLYRGTAPSRQLMCSGHDQMRREQHDVATKPPTFSLNLTSLDNWDMDSGILPSKWLWMRSSLASPLPVAISAAGSSWQCSKH